MVLAVPLLAVNVAAAEWDFSSEVDLSSWTGQASSFPALSPEDLDADILALMEANKIPGVQACVILRDEIVWTGVYGYADADLTIPVTNSTLFLQGSVSKKVIATALLQCVEDGLVDLDADVSDYLSFPVQNPHYPATPITCRMILSHVSSIARNDGAWLPDMRFDEDWAGDINQYMEDYLVPGGATYDAFNYLTHEPGTYSQYSNYAYTLLALVIENVTGLGFEEYVQESVFAPLSMNESSWFPSNLDVNNIAMPTDSKRDYWVGQYPRSVAGGDLDSDGDEDLVVANRDSDDISVLLGVGNGIYQPVVNYPAGDAPALVVLCQLNNDSHLDLAVANADSDDISVLIGNGDGTFQAAISVPAGDSPWSVCGGDLDDDGAVDLAVANGTSNTVTVHINNGDATFQTPVEYPVGNAPRSVLAADLNGDPYPDLAVSRRYSGNVSILLNNGDGTFYEAGSYSTGTYPANVSAGHFDSDADLDLAVVNSLSNNVSVLLNNGDATFSAAVSYATGANPQKGSVGDLNGDGYDDLAVPNGNSSSVSILIGNGDGTFQTAVDYNTGAGPTSTHCVDTDGDGAPDVVVTNSLWNNISILISNGDGTMADHVALGHVSHPLRPIGLLRTSSIQMAHHLALVATGGTYQGETLLEPATVEQIMANHFPDVYEDPTPWGLGWQRLTVNGEIVWGMQGGLPGALSLAYVNPVNGNGAVLASNLYLNSGHADIFDMLMAFSEDVDGDGVLIADDNCPLTYNPTQSDLNGNGIGDACDVGCCLSRVGDANGSGSDEPTISDISVLIDAKFITGTCDGVVGCPPEADINQSGGAEPTCDDITIGDISILIDYLFITGSTLGLPDCL